MIGLIAKNTFYLTLATISQKILVFFYFIFLARFLGAADFGKYTFALAFSILFAIITSLGFEHVITREVAREKEKAQEYLGNVLSLKIFLAFFTFLIIFLAVNLLNYSSVTKTIVYFAGLAVIIDSFTTVFCAIFRAFQNLKYEAIGFLGSYFLITGIGSLALFFGFRLVPAMIIYLLGNLANFLFVFYFICKRIGPPKFLFKKEMIKFLLSTALPFALSGIFIKIYGSIDTVMLSKLKGDEVVGFYNAAFKPIFSLQFIPVIFMASIYPIMSSLFVVSLEKLKKIFFKGFKYLLIISLPLSFGIFALADKIILLMYGKEYLKAISALEILAFMTVFVFLNYILGTLLNSVNRQKTNMYIDVSGMALNVILNCLLIPSFSLNGAALASVITLGFILFLRIIIVKKILRFRIFILIKDGLKILFSSLIIYSGLIFFKNSFSLFILFFLAVVLYFLILYLVRGFDKEDIKIFRSSFR